VRQFEGYIRVKIFRGDTVEGKIFRGDTVEGIRVRSACALRVFAAEHVFSEMVQAYRHPCTVRPARRFEGGGEILAGDKALRQAARRAIGSDPAAETGAFCEFEQERAQHQVLRLTMPGKSQTASDIFVGVEKFFGVDRGHAA